MQQSAQGSLIIEARVCTKRDHADEQTRTTRSAMTSNGQQLFPRPRRAMTLSRIICQIFFRPGGNDGTVFAQATPGTCPILGFRMGRISGQSRKTETSQHLLQGVSWSREGSGASCLVRSRTTHVRWRRCVQNPFHVEAWMGRCGR